MKVAPLLAALAAVTPAGAQSARPAPAEIQPLQQHSGAIREQALAAGRITGSVDIAVPLGETPVTIRSVTPSSASGQYRISFSLLDVDGDGFISRDEALANRSLADEFNALDVKRRGRLDRADLAGWLVD
ncbi:EF-hand domain-containing protein [Stenotrophomonas sp. Sa5BUN4]|uniref:EF-hand domain-containing protein n=2 Tax=Stenotrophomonas lacuserhaii TaxID=2760084 RepID=A0A8X8FZZ9_9GAMM|nr:EF-hand domain-containing protein [Stenotrophomonas pennii]MBD7955947.1 EF-hand domain-containing protein [Stenotrophomonas pennii]